VKFVFGLFMLYVALRMVYSAGTKWFGEGAQQMP
jgi:hypothetical protein